MGVVEKLALRLSGKNAALLQRPLLVTVAPDEYPGRCGRVLSRALLEPGSTCWLGHFKFVTLDVSLASCVLVFSSAG